MAFVVLTYNRSDALLAVLASLAPQCLPGDSVVIADDGSDAVHVAALKSGLPRFACPVRHVWHPDVGFTAARARNLGAAHAGHDYIVFLDGDCIPNARFVELHRALAQRGCFVNGSRALLSERLSANVLAGQIDLPHQRAADWVRHRLSGDVNKLTQLVRWPAAPGRYRTQFRWKGIRSCNFGVWYGDLQTVNGFDESFSGWGHEDADLVLRLHNLGCIRKDGYFATEVFHLWHRDSSRANEEVNQLRVLQRLASGTTRSEVGMAEAGNQSAAVVTELND